MIAALSAVLLSIILIFPFAMLVFGLMCWIDLFVCAWSTGDTTAAWAIDMKVTGVCAVIFTTLGGWGCWAVVTRIAGAVG